MLCAIQMDLLPTVFGQDWRYIFLQVIILIWFIPSSFLIVFGARAFRDLQQVSGTVTIVPSPTLRNYLRVISDPTRADMVQYLRKVPVARVMLVVFIFQLAV